ncbi:alpha/beta hydrolase [Agromyces silvae]|uniref:alpha/beta hydrolase n=1 Tax=Agromyces silvae TaxID=3388266 RepID=UPI00280A627D|nr:alpha/beta hydrolase [Agromyces protaetiae]
MSTAHATAPARRDAVSWVGFGVAVAGLLVCAWACLTAWSAIVHGHPAYAILLAVTALVSAGAAWWTLRRRIRRGGWRRAGRIALIVLAAVWLGLTAWLRPYSAVEPALAAMHSGSGVSVAETPTEIVLTPQAVTDPVGVLFQPGALVDARAYAAVLRPLAEDGHTVVIVKQPLGIAFLALGALDRARADHPDVQRWVVGGHSLGGTVAAMEATGTEATGTEATGTEATGTEATGTESTGTAPVGGLLLYASYPASDLSSSLRVSVESVSGTRDGLATPEKIAASRADLPPDAQFTVITGASHAQFGDYGPQPGDNAPTISHDDARRQISAASLDFLDRIADR